MLRHGPARGTRARWPEGQLSSIADTYGAR